MKLHPPDPEIDLYETGFGAADPFSRIETGKSLSDLVERVEDPLVVALDGGWGSGKTWFLKRWVGAHRLENDGRANTVYFDAFAHDFMDDPLIALTGVIGDRLPQKDETKAWSKVKKAAARLTRPVVRIGLAAATGGATEFAGPVMDAAVEATSKEIEAATRAFWSREDGKRAAMEQFRAALVELTNTGVMEHEDPVPLVVVVDELDRCRPDYALALLEIIKHFFSVPNVHFVLGVSLEALGHSVRARYGTGIDADRYLRKFISISLQLPENSNDHNNKPFVMSYFHQMATRMGIGSKTIEIFDRHLDLVAGSQSLTMRDMNQILSRLALVKSSVFSRSAWGWGEALSSMILFRFAEPAMERKALDGNLTVGEVRAFYGISSDMLDEDKKDTFKRSASVISSLWEFVITNGAKPEKYRDQFSKGFDTTWGIDNARDVPHIVLRDYLDKFILLVQKQ
ncbi:KAP family P-loop NTPase fold protein [Pukyongiella litopenaei]|uniref:KAP NTPase domain-containing protein n=1 Tax=Pukyongiella litopenaei TaxID=2605946 RepID=A0A2S0MND3_9RHOB|nr:P-loop NTPase fold protein [Pukyongiella litopenaei]AVO37399.2 hypothetical protein C6Y53_06530 [Pukyongiella litopenaei]